MTDSAEQIKRAIRDTAMFMADMTGRADPAVRVASASVLLSSLIVSTVQPENRMATFDKMVKEMRHHIAQANAKQRKSSK